MSLEGDLLTSLKALRAGSGLTEARLREQPTLLAHLDMPTAKEGVERLTELVDQISDPEQCLAVRYAYGLEGSKKRQATQRREAAVKVIPMSLRTLDRREIAGLTDLARIIIEQSPKLTEQQRQDEIDVMASTAKRIEDLEMAVSLLGRVVLARIDHGKFTDIMQASVDDDWEDFLGAIGEIIERSSEAGRIAMSEMDKRDLKSRRPDVDTSWADEDD